MAQQNQHYVPQFLLRPFALNKNKQIHVFDKSNSNSFVSAIENVASEKGFYDSEATSQQAAIETDLSKLESQAAAVIRKIIDKKSLSCITSDERRVLSSFAAIQQLRTKGAREQMQSLYAQLLRWMKEKGFDPSKYSELENITPDIVKQDSIEMLMLSDQFAELYAKKVWLLQECPVDTVLYTSDNPIFMYNFTGSEGQGRIGLDVEGVEIQLPIAPNLSLCFLCEKSAEKFRSAPKVASFICGCTGIPESRYGGLEKLARALETGEPIVISEDNVTHLNSRQVFGSSRFVFSNNGEFSLAEKMLKENPALASPDSGLGNVRLG